LSGEGIPVLLAAIGGRLQRKKVRGLMQLNPSQGRQRALLFEMGAVLQEQSAEDGGWILELELVERDFRRFLKREKLPADILRVSPVNQPANATLQR
jgi:GTP-binding protein HflX